MNMAGANPEVRRARFDDLADLADLLTRASTAVDGQGADLSLLPEVGSGA